MIFKGIQSARATNKAGTRKQVFVAVVNVKRCEFENGMSLGNFCCVTVHVLN